jgi:hypothetical protein
MFRSEHLEEVDGSEHLCEAELRVFTRLLFLLASWAAGMLCAVERAADGLEVEAQESRREADAGDAPVAREPAHGRFAHLQDARELARGQKLFARLFPVWVRVLHLFTALAYVAAYFEAGLSDSATRKMAAPSMFTSSVTGCMPSAFAVTR